MTYEDQYGLAMRALCRKEGHRKGLPIVTRDIIGKVQYPEAYKTILELLANHHLSAREIAEKTGFTLVFTQSRLKQLSDYGKAVFRNGKWSI